MNIILYILTGVVLAIFSYALFCEYEKGYLKYWLTKDFWIPKNSKLC